MDIATPLLTIAGLVLFETIVSIDNAIINAEVLSTMSQKARRWFMTWGLFIAVFLVRGLLPWLMVWLATPGLSPLEALTATFSSDPVVIEAIETAAPILLAGGGTFLIFLFLHWLFVEPKHFGLRGERFILEKGVWFYAVASVALLLIVWLTLQSNPVMAFSAVVGSTGFFIVSGFRMNAEAAEKRLVGGDMSDWSKILYLEIIDATFSIDSVIGAFAFTLSVPLIIIGTGIGALVVREVTVRHVETVRRYPFLKNGAMYSIGVLGVIMMLDAFGVHVPTWVSPAITFALVGFFLWKSMRYIGTQEAEDLAEGLPDSFSLDGEESPHRD